MDHRIGEERKKGGLLKTGQTTQYDGYKDDGYFQKGLSKRYTVLTTGRYAGTTNITLNGLTDAHSNNCVYDKRSKLMWTRYVTGSIGPASDGNIPWTTNGNGEGIFTYADAANASGLAGYSDWRIPNRKELESLAEAENIDPAINTTNFPSFPLEMIWTGTTNKKFLTNATTVQFIDGAIPYQGRNKTEQFKALLVRGGI